MDAPDPGKTKKFISKYKWLRTVAHKCLQRVLTAWEIILRERSWPQREVDGRHRGKNTPMGPALLLVFSVWFHVSLLVFNLC